MVAITGAVVLAVSIWIFMSTTVIIFNAQLLQGYRHPITLIAWHMLVASVLVLVVRVLKPSLVETGDATQGLAPLTCALAIKLGAPVATTHVLSMIAGNTAYLYLSIGFIQMIKAWTAQAVYIVGCFVGTQKFSWSVAKTIFIMTLGLTLASYGELNFNLYGFILQVVSISLEGGRINLLELTLKAKGYKLNPVSSLQVFAPIMLVMLLPLVAIWDRDALSIEELTNVGAIAFSANALCAFFLNLSVYLVIQTASGLIFALGGIFKDCLIIFGSVVFLGKPVTGIQLAGYSIALTALQAYGIVSKDAAFFDEHGVVLGFWKHFHVSSPKGKYSEVATKTSEDELEVMSENSNDSLSRRAAAPPKAERKVEDSDHKSVVPELVGAAEDR